MPLAICVGITLIFTLLLAVVLRPLSPPRGVCDCLILKYIYQIVAYFTVYCPGIIGPFHMLVQ